MAGLMGWLTVSLSLLGWLPTCLRTDFISSKNGIKFDIWILPRVSSSGDHHLSIARAYQVWMNDEAACASDLWVQSNPKVNVHIQFRQFIFYVVSNCWRSIVIQILELPGGDIVLLGLPFLHVIWSSIVSVSESLLIAELTSLRWKRERKRKTLTLIQFLLQFNCWRESLLLTVNE